MRPSTTYRSEYRTGGRDDLGRETATSEMGLEGSASGHVASQDQGTGTGPRRRIGKARRAIGLGLRFGQFLAS